MFSKIFQFYLKTDQRKNKPKNFLFKPISFFFKKNAPNLTVRSIHSILQITIGLFPIKKARTQRAKQITKT